MKRSLKSCVVGVVALAGATLASVEVEAMPVQPLSSTIAPAGSIEHVWWRGGYGYRGYGFRRGFYGYGFRRPIYGFGWRRPYYGYGWRRYGWRRW